MVTKRTSIIATLVLVGETSWEREGRMRGAADLPLSDPGRAIVGDEVARLGDARIPTVYAAGGEASVETARLVAGAVRGRVKIVDAFGDPDLGLFAGLRESELFERYPRRHKQWLDNPLALVPPEGEPIAEARARQLAAVARVLKKSRADEVVLVLPPLAFGFLRCWFADRPPSAVRSMLADGTRVERTVIPIVYLERLRSEAKAETIETGGAR